MSHKAVTWAIEQRGISPAAKIVLWHLCDRYHPDHGCFPSQETLADDCELSRSSLNNQLNALETVGLIKREQRRDEATNRQQATRYRFPFEDDFDGEPCPNIGHGAVSKNDASRVQIVGHGYKAEPVIEPVIERECAREEIEAFEKARKTWPTGFADSREEALSAWEALSTDDRRTAYLEIERFVTMTKSFGRKFFGTFASYLAERKWTALPDRPQERVRVTAGERREPPKPPKTKFLEQWERQHGGTGA